MAFYGKKKGSTEEYRFFRNMTSNKIIEVVKEDDRDNKNLRPGDTAALTQVEVELNMEREPFQAQEIAEVTEEVTGKKVEKIKIKTNKTGASGEEVQSWASDLSEEKIIENAKKLKVTHMLEKLITLCKKNNKSWLLVEELMKVKKAVDDSTKVIKDTIPEQGEK